MHNLPDALIEVANDRLPGICEVRGLFTGIFNLFQRLASSMSRGPSQGFLALSRLNSVFSHIEEKMDQWFHSIRPNEFGERDCSLDLVGYVGELEHAPCFIASGVDLGAAELQLGLALAFDYKLKTSLRPLDWHVMVSWSRLKIQVRRMISKRPTTAH